MIGMAATTTGTTGATVAVPDEDEELLDDELAPPPPAPLKRELTDAVEADMADERRVPKVDVPVANGDKRLSSHSEI